MTYTRYEKGCAITIPQENQTDAWWKAEVHQLSYISTIRIMPRRDCCQSNYNSVTVSTSVDGKTWTLCEDLGSRLSTARTWVTAICSIYTMGKYIKFIQHTVNDEFTVCEVEVFGFPAGNCFYY